MGAGGGRRVVASTGRRGGHGLFDLLDPFLEIAGLIGHRPHGDPCDGPPRDLQSKRHLRN